MSGTKVITVRKAAYRRIALAVLTAAGCMNGLKRAREGAA